MTVLEPINAPQVARLRVSDFLLLNDAGAFERYGKSELIEGEIWVMNAAYSAHARIQAELAFQLRLALAEAKFDATVYTALAVEMSEDSMPEPDVVVAAFHASGRMALDQVYLAVEVSDTTLSIDLGRKAQLYARCGVPEYWVADIEARRIHRMSQPLADGNFGRTDTFPFGEPVPGATIPGLVVATHGL